MNGLRIKSFFIATLCLGVDAIGAPTTIDLRRLQSMGCTLSSGVCQATLDVALTGSANNVNCSSTQVVWDGRQTSGAMMSQEAYKALAERRYVSITYDPARCSQIQADRPYFQALEIKGLPF